MKKRFVIGMAIAATVIFGLATNLPAGDFPEKPVTCVVGFGPGGMTDVVSRILADRMEKELGQKVIVENKPGSGGYNALKNVIEGDPDGYKFVSCSTSTAAGTRLLGKPISSEEIGLVGSFMSQPRVLFARKDAPFQDFEGLIDYAKKEPVTFAGGGSMWAAKTVEAMAKELELNIRIVPFRSGSEGSAAILGGHVTLAETGVGTGAWQSALKDDLNIIAVLTDDDLKDYGFPEVKSIKDYGVTYYVRMRYGYAVPAGVPEERRQKLENALKLALEDPGVVKKMKELDLRPSFLPGEEYRPIIEAAIEESGKMAEYLEED